ncbi:MAG: DegV family protein [Oscillospiraceae bacterium]
MKIKVTADSTCDLSPALLTQYDVTLAPLTVIKDGTDYVDGRTITPQEIFRHVAAGRSLCSTAAVSVGEYQALFARFAGSCDGLVHVTIGSDFSACYQNACLAAAEFPNVRVIDSRNLSTGQGHVVLEACRLGKSAASLEALCQELEQLTGKVEASFLLNRLDYMVKGGRCSTVAALGANLLNLKPCIEVRDGKMQVVKKYRGPYAKCLAHYVKDRLDGRPDLRRDRLFVTYTPVEPDCLEAVREAVDQYGHFQEVYETSAGCTVSCHCGPGTLGVLFIRQ